MKKTMCFVVILLIGCVFQARAAQPVGVVANNNTNSIQLINPTTFELSDNLPLKGDLGSYGGGLFDVVITPNGKTAIVSNFGDSKIFFIDISGGFEVAPTLLGSVDIPFFAEDMDITPNGKYALVSDGGFSPRLAVVDIDSMSLLFNHNLHGASAQSVAISPNGKTVLVADYFGMAIHAYDLDNDGMLTFKDTYYLDYFRPVNVTISPNGKTAIVACANRYDFPVFAICEVGNLVLKSIVTTPAKGGQSVVFSKDSKKAYYLSNSVNHGSVVNVLNVTEESIATLETSIELSIPRGTSQLFGVDTIALDPSGNYLYVTNPTVSGGVVEITVIDTTTNTEVNQLPANGIPVGIDFAHNE